MKQTALVTGADRGLGSALCAGLLARGWRVVAGQFLPDWPELGALSEQHPEALHVVPLDVGSVAFDFNFIFGRIRNPLYAY